MSCKPALGRVHLGLWHSAAGRKMKSLAHSDRVTLSPLTSWRQRLTLHDGRRAVLRDDLFPLCMMAFALLWLWRVDRVPVTVWDLSGVVVVLIGMSIIVWGGWQG